MPPVIALSSGGQYDFIHNINYDGFDASLDSIVSVLLNINIEYVSTSGGGSSDPTDNTSTAIDCTNTGGVGTDSVGIVIPGGVGGVSNTGNDPDCDLSTFPPSPPSAQTIFKVEADSQTFSFLSTNGTTLDMVDITLTSLTDGLLNVRLFDVSSNINFLSSSLTVMASRSSVVPEPSVLLLMGSGLLGLGFITRRRLYSL